MSGDVVLHLILSCGCCESLNVSHLTEYKHVL